LSLAAFATGTLPDAAAQGSLFPSGSLSLVEEDDFDLAAAAAYPISIVTVPRAIDRPLDRVVRFDGGRDLRGRPGTHAFSPLGNRAGSARIPSYQIYRPQQHQGQLGGFGTQQWFTSPNEIGHGGAQGNFYRSQYAFDRNRAPNFEIGPLSGNFDAFASTEWLDRLPTTVSAPGSED